MFNLIVFGMLMGFAFAAPPGIVAAETLRRGIARGFPSALSVQLGSLIGDATYCLLALAGVAALTQNAMTRSVLGAFGVLLLCYLAITGLRAEFATPSGNANRVVVPADRCGAFVTGVLLSLTNPWAIGYWLALGGALSAAGAMESNGAMVLFFVGFFGICAAYAVVSALLIGLTRRALSATAARAISIASNVLIGIFAIGLAYKLAQMIFI